MNRVMKLTDVLVRDWGIAASLEEEYGSSVWHKHSSYLDGMWVAVNYGPSFAGRDELLSDIGMLRDMAYQRWLYPLKTGEL